MKLRNVATVRRLLGASIALIATSIWLPVSAQGTGSLDGERNFYSPSGNVGCVLYIDEGEAIVRCLISKTDKPLPPQPADCDLDWGDFGVSSKSRKGYMICHGDTIAGLYPKLPYGHSVSVGDITCMSDRIGVTCRNGRGAGFFLSRAKQQLF